LSSNKRGSEGGAIRASDRSGNVASWGGVSQGRNQKRHKTGIQDSFHNHLQGEEFVVSLRCNPMSRMI